MQPALSLGGVGEKGVTEQPWDLLRLDAQDLYRRAIGPENTSVYSLMDIRYGCFLKKVVELFLALGEALVRFAQLQAHRHRLQHRDERRTRDGA